MTGSLVMALTIKMQEEKMVVMSMEGRIPPGDCARCFCQLWLEYLNYVDQLLQHNHKCSIATYHYQIQQAATLLIKKI